MCVTTVKIEPLGTTPLSRAHAGGVVRRAGDGRRAAPRPGGHGRVQEGGAGAQGGRGGGEGHGSGGKSVVVFPRLVMSRPFHFVFSKGIEAFDTEKAMFEPKVGALC